MAKKKTVNWWKKKVWKEAFSPFIRLRDAIKTTGSQHTCLCVTCGKPYPAFGRRCLQAGHFQPGRKNQFLFDEKQVNGQCYYCNITLKGNWPAYLEYMVKRYGQKEVDKMLFDGKNVIRQFTCEELEDKYNYYLGQIEALKSQPKPDILARRKAGDTCENSF